MRNSNEKASIIKELREKGYQLKHLLRAMRMAKSTYYFEINKVDVVKSRNERLMAEIQEIFIRKKVGTEFEESAENL